LKAALTTHPEAFALRKSYPNPATRQATVEYALPEPAEVTITVYDVLGRRVVQLVNGQEKAGQHTAYLKTKDIPSGSYFVRMRAKDFSETRRLTVVR
jgi:hypothetical protein